MRKTYSLETAKVLLELAYPGWDFPPYAIRDDGVYQSDEHREASPSEEVFDWSPAYDMSSPDAPDPMTAPMLPIPFSAADLAAFMIDGAGSMIPEALGGRVGDHTPSLELLAHPRMRKAREALHEAFVLLDQAVQQNGPPNYEELAYAHVLVDRYDEENGVANEREGVFEPGISNDERRLRRARAVASVQEAKERSEHANTVANQNWKKWRKRMVHALLEGSRSVDISGERCRVLARERKLHIDHWIELTGVGVGQHESYFVANDRVAFRKWEDDFIAAAPKKTWQVEMLNDNRVAPELAFPCSPQELLTFVDTAIGIHCFMVPDAFRAVVLSLNREKNGRDGFRDDRITVHDTKKRRHTLDHELDVAIKNCGHENDAVWSALKLAAEKGDKEYPALIGVVAEGIQYRGHSFEDTGEPDVLTKKQCSERLRKRRNKNG